MFTKLKKVSVVTTALALAFAILLALFMPIGNTAAFADVGPHIPNEETPVYYISDYAGSYQIKNELINNGVVDNIELYCFSYDEKLNKTYYEQWKDYLQQLEYYYDVFDNFVNAYIIFEVRHEFKKEIKVDDTDYVFTDWLCDHFSSWDSNGCKIMFICNTDENQFGAENEFLAYADIHVNLNKEFTFFTSIFYRAIQASNDSKLKDCIFILDKKFGNTQKDDNIFYNTYLMPFIKSVYKDILKSTPVFSSNTKKESDKYFEDFLNDDTELLDDNIPSITSGCNITILCHEHDDYYFDLIRRTSIDLTNATKDFVANRKIYAIGTTSAGYAYSQNWISSMIGLKNSLGMEENFEIYVYNSEGYSFEEYSNSYVFCSNPINYDELYEIIAAFLNDEDLTKYNNWDGRCEITHKFVTIGSGGWMVNVGEQGEVIEGWTLYMNEEDFNYYFHQE